MWHVPCISLCGVLVFLDGAHNSLYCSSDIPIPDTSWCGAYIAFFNMVYFLCFPVWRTLYCVWWGGVYIVLQTYIVFPDKPYIQYFLIWRTSCISWCGVLYMAYNVSPDVAHILFFRHTYISWYGVFLVFSDVAYIILSDITWCGVYIVIHVYTYIITMIQIQWQTKLQSSSYRTELITWNWIKLVLKIIKFLLWNAYTRCSFVPFCQFMN